MEKKEEVHYLDLGDGVTGEIVILSGTYHNSTSTYFEKEYRCSLLRGNLKIYLNSLDSLEESENYLLHLKKNRFSPEDTSNPSP